MTQQAETFRTDDQITTKDISEKKESEQRIPQKADLFITPQTIQLSYSPPQDTKVRISQTHRAKRSQYNNRQSTQLKDAPQNIRYNKNSETRQPHPAKKRKKTVKMWFTSGGS
jgi:hypothetical protein